MRVGMAVDTPHTNSDRQHLANLADALEDLAFMAERCGLWFNGEEAAPMLKQLSKQINESLGNE